MIDGESLPLITVITVCWNSAATLSRTMESVLTQSYENIEYILVDGASSDETVEIIAQNESRFRKSGKSLRWISEPDLGIYHAMNKGLAMATGDIIGILNSDDFYEPGSIEAVARASERDPDVGIFYGFLRVLIDDVELWTYRYRYERYLLNLDTGVHSAAQHPTCFVHRDVYEQIGAFDTSFPVAADYDFLIRAMKAGIKFMPLDSILTNFTRGGTSDRMNDYERLKQRFDIWYKNGLLTEDEYHERQKQLRYKNYKQLKKRIAEIIFRYVGIM